MNNLQFNIDNYKNIYEIPYAQKCLINDRKFFPNEMIKEIFSYLSGCGLGVRLVCHKWNRTLIEEDRNDLKILQQFVACCSRVLHRRFFYIKEAKGSTLIKMMKLRQDIDLFKFAIVTAFTSLKKMELQKLEEKTKAVIHATFLKNIFWLVNVYKKLDDVFEVGINISEENRDYIYKILSETRTVSQDLENHIEDRMGNVGGRLCEMLLMEGDFVKVLKVSEKLTIGEKNWNSIQHSTANLLITLGHLKKAMEVCSTIFEDDEKKSTIYAEIAIALIHRGQIDVALEVVQKLIADEYYNSNALSLLVQELIALGKIDKAYEVVVTISIDSIRNDPYKGLALDHIMKGEVERALEILNKRVTKKYRHNLYMVIIDKYIAMNCIQKAFEFINNALNEYDEGMAYGAIAVFYIKNRKLDEAFETANFKPGTHLAQVYVYSYISSYYLKIGDVSQAEKAALKIGRITTRIKDEEMFLEACMMKDECFSNISDTLKSLGKQSLTPLNSG